MTVQFDDKRITLFVESVCYDTYYFAIATEDDSTDYRAVVRRVLGQWAEVLARAGGGGEALCLPFGIYDQCVECFAATTVRGRVTLRCVWVSVEGHTLDLRDLRAFMETPQEVVKSCPEDFGVYERAALITALATAEPATA